MPQRDGGPAGPAPQARSARTWLRRALIAALLAPVVALLLLWVATRPTVLATLVAWRLSALLGGEVHVDAVHYLGDGRVRVDRLLIRVPEWPGPAGELASAERISAQVDLSSIWRGGVEITEFRIDGSVLRLAERADHPNQFNIFGLQLPSQGGAAPRTLPRIELPAMRVEFGDLLGDGRFALRGSTTLAGDLRLAPGSSTEYLLKLAEIQPDGPHEVPGGMQITGSFDRRTLAGSVHLGRLSFDDRMLAFLPKVVRDWWSRLEFRGEVLKASVSVAEDRPLALQLVVGSSELTVPVDAGLNWMIVHRGRMEPSTGRPRIRVSGGTITARGSALTFERIEGQILGTGGRWPLAAVPLRIDLSIPDLPQFTWNDRTRWLDEALSSAGFEGRIQLVDFAVGLSRIDEAIELPYAVADVLDAFRLSTWDLSADLRIQRPSPVYDASGKPITRPVHYQGKAAISDATLQYEKFAYSLRKVRGILSFDEDAIVIESFQGEGRSGGNVVVTGRIAPPGPQAGFDVDISGADIPINDRLRRALPTEARAVVDALVDRDAIAGLLNSELLLDEAALREARQRAAESLAAVDPGSDEARVLRGSIESLDRRLSVVPVEAGGTLSFDMDVRRPVGGQTMPLSITGQIDLGKSGGAFNLFPYPFRITKGVITLERDSVDLGEGVELVTIGGGVGRVEGRVDFPQRPDGSTEFRPDLRITVVDERVNPLLLAAIPPSAPDREAIRDAGLTWPGTGRSDATKLLEAIALRGEVEGRANVTTAADGQMSWKVVLSLLNGSAMPTPQLEELLRDSRLAWPPELALSDLSALLTIDPEELIVNRAQGSAGGATLNARGRVNVLVEPPTLEAQATLDDVEVAPWMVALAPPEDRARLSELWERLQPSGIIDASLDMNVIEGQAATTLTIAPRQFEADLSGQRVSVERRGGELRMGGRGLIMEELDLALRTDGRDHGTVELHGALPNGRSPGQVEGAWRRARFECPLIDEALRLAGLRRAVEVAERLRPEGSFDAAFSLNLSPDWSILHHSATVTPHELDLLLGGERLELAFAEGSIDSSESLVRFRELRGRHQEGTFAVDGQAHLGPEPTIDAAVDVESDRYSSAFQALMPEEVADAIEAIDLELGEGFDAEGQLGLRSTPEGWWASWKGPVGIRGGSMQPGIDVRGMNGRVVVEASGGGDRPAALRLDLLLDTLRVAGRRVDSAVGVVELDPPNGSAPRKIRVKSLRGGVYGGVAELFGEIDPATGGEYSIGLAVAGAGLAGLERSEGEDVDPDVPDWTPHEGEEGRIRALITLGGRTGDGAARRGRGAVYLDDARIADMPIMMALLQFTQFMLPLRGSLSEGLFEFYILGDEVVFDRLLLTSETLEMFGRGTLSLEDMTLNVQFDPRGRLPLVSDLMSPLSGNLWAIEIHGPLESPRASILPLPTLHALFAGHAGGARSMVSAPEGPRALRPTSRTPNESDPQPSPPSLAPPRHSAAPLSPDLRINPSSSAPTP
jgi:hypothetical protein